MRCFVLHLLASWSALSAQVMIRADVAESQNVIQLFERTEQGAKNQLRCTAVKIPPRLGFDFRTWSGYVVTAPLGQFDGAATELAIMTRVTARETGKKHYLVAGRYSIPKLEKPKGHEVTLDGAFYLGKGVYDVDLIAADQELRTCRKSWSVKVNPGKVEGGYADNVVLPMTPSRWNGFEKPGEGRVSVLLHAAPVSRRRFAAKLTALDRTILLNTLSSILKHGNFGSARVVAFDLDGRRVLFTSDDFQPASFRELAKKLQEADFGTVDIRTLNHGPRPDAMLADLLAKEAAQPNPSDSIVFLGPAHRFAGKMLEEVREVKMDLPPTYYFTFSPWKVAPSDWIDSVVKKLARGKVVPIATPEDLSNAIRNLSRRSGSGSERNGVEAQRE